MSKLSEAEQRINELEAALAAANTKIETLEHAQPARTKAPTKAQVKAQAEAERKAMTAHLSADELAAIAASDKNNPFAPLAHVVQQPTRKGARSMKPYTEWKERAHFAASDALEVVSLHQQGLTNAEIAKRKGCHPAYIAAILKGKQWSTVTSIETK